MDQSAQKQVASLPCVVQVGFAGSRRLFDDPPADPDTERQWHDAVRQHVELGQLLHTKAMHADAEPLMRRALAIHEKSYGAEHSDIATDLNNLAQLLQVKAEEAHDAQSRAALLSEAERPMRRVVEIFISFGNATGHEHPHMQAVLANYRLLLEAMDLSSSEIQKRLQTVMQNATVKERCDTTDMSPHEFPP